MISIVKFSQDGVYVVAVTAAGVVDNTIIVINSATGVIANARQYSGGSSAQYYGKRSVVMSSGRPGYRAYMVSKNKVGMTCSGNQLFSFDPLDPTIPALWAKSANSFSCDHFGISFGGPSEDVIYAYIHYMGKLTITRIFDNGGGAII